MLELALGNGVDHLVSGTGALAAAGRRALHTRRVVDDTLEPGSIISGRFRLQRLLGRGGMASVWEAYHVALDIEVAIKFLEPKWCGSDEVRSRFAQEATAIARIRSPHVVHVLDYGFTELGRGYIVMELLRGEDLGQRLVRSTRLGLVDTATLVNHACRGLGKAHAIGIIHRDIKPENLFLVADDDGFFVKLLDFGVAKAIGVEAATHQTDTGQLVGTPLYMSPEQALGRVIDGRSDLYSLATVAYRCLTGRPPFVEKHVGELLVAVSTIVPQAPSTFDPALPGSVDVWFASIFSKDPNARCCQTVHDFAATFDAACRGIAPLSAGAVGHAASLREAEAPTLPGESNGHPLDRFAGGRGVTDATLAAALNPAPSSGADRTGRRSWLALTLMGTLAGLGSLAIWAQQHSGVSRSTVLATQSAPLQTASAPPRTVSVELSVTPSTASLYLDGRLLPGNPFSGTEPFDTGAHRMRAEAAGYLSRETDLKLDRDVRLELRLSLLPTPASNTLPTAERRSDGDGVPPRKTKEKKAASKPDSKESSPGATRPRVETPTDGPSRKRPLELDRTSPWNSP